jgi:hypothetical protein
MIIWNREMVGLKFEFDEPFAEAKQASGNA